MRTTAEAQRSPAHAARGTAAAGRRGRGAEQPSQEAAGSPPPEPQTPAEPTGRATPIAVSAVRMVRVEEGLYALRVGELAGATAEVAGLSLPLAQIAAPIGEDGNSVDIVASFPATGPWLGRSGGTAILRSPPRGGFVIVTVYGGPGQEAAAPAVDLQRLDGPVTGGGTVAPMARPAQAAAPATGGRDISAEVLLHIERAGDRLFPARGWVGALGRRMRIEAFSIRPLERLAPADIEMKGFLPNGGETAWVPGGVLCGTRGRGLPLIGFAIRIAPQRAGQFAVSYQGSFFSGGISEPHQNGAPCRSATQDDPLEAINVRLVEHGADPQTTDTPA
jgi:hypothetical protein